MITKIAKVPLAVVTAVFALASATFIYCNRIMIAKRPQMCSKHPSAAAWKLALHNSPCLVDMTLMVA